MPSSFTELLSQASIFKDRNVLSPHYIPETLPHREKEIERIMKTLSPALKAEKPSNLFVYGKTGTGKTASSKHVLEKFNEMKRNALMWYVNCRIHNSRYRILKLMADAFLPEGNVKAGHALSHIYEKILDWVEEDGKHLIIVLDEIDMIKDLNDLVYTLTRSNDDLKKGGISILGISNKVSFKEELDPRSKSTLYETELVFSPYTPQQLHAILKQRVAAGFAENVVEDSALNLAAAIVAQETGDARYALKLLFKAGEIADENKRGKVTDREVEEARKTVDEDITVDAISTLPEHQQLVLYSVASLVLAGGKYSKLSDKGDDFLLSGEVFERYLNACRTFSKKPRSARWYREYLNDLEMLGLITMIDSGKGLRGHTRLIKIAYSAEKVREVIEKLLLR